MSLGRDYVHVDPTEGGETVRDDSELQAGRTCQAFQHGAHPLQTCPTRFVKSLFHSLFRIKQGYHYYEWAKRTVCLKYTQSVYVLNFLYK